MATFGLSRNLAVIGLMAAGAFLLALGGYQAMQKDGGSKIETSEPYAAARPESEKEPARSRTAISRSDSPGELEAACTSLVPQGARMICSGFEPDWAVKFVCNGTTMRANFSTSWSGETLGTARFSGQNPWSFNTSHGVVGSIVYKPGGCVDDNARYFDFTLTASAVPELGGRLEPICCRLE